MKPYLIVKVPARMDRGERVPPASLVGGTVVEQFEDRDACKRRAAELRAAHPAFYYYPQFNYAAVHDVKATTRAVDVEEPRPRKKTRRRRIQSNVIPLKDAGRGA